MNDEGFETLEECLVDAMSLGDAEGTIEFHEADCPSMDDGECTCKAMLVPLTDLYLRGARQVAASLEPFFPPSSEVLHGDI